MQVEVRRQKKLSPKFSPITRLRFQKCQGKLFYRWDSYSDTLYLASCISLYTYTKIWSKNEKLLLELVRFDCFFSLMKIVHFLQIKTAVRYHLTLVRMAIIKKSTNNKCWRGCGEKETPVNCWWECKLVQPLWKIVWSFLKRIKIEYQMIQQFHSWVYIQKKQKL